MMSGHRVIVSVLSAALLLASAGTKGFVLLSGVHPEAPESWRETKGFTNLPDTDGYSTDIAYAKSLITAALNGALLAHY